MSFSTLYGSKWVATTCCPKNAAGRGSFSTLYGSKWVATLAVPLHGARYLTFQYPLRVEVGCNLTTNSEYIHPCVFQYPLRVEVGCNQHYLCAAVPACRVSVPSTGRSGLQPVYNMGARARYAGFSTLYGSKWVATLNAPVSVPVPVFQYPLRVEVGCNTRQACKRAWKK